MEKGAEIKNGKLLFLGVFRTDLLDVVDWKYDLLLESDELLGLEIELLKVGVEMFNGELLLKLLGWLRFTCRMPVVVVLILKFWIFKSLSDNFNCEFDVSLDWNEVLNLSILFTLMFFEVKLLTEGKEIRCCELLLILFDMLRLTTKLLVSVVLKLKLSLFFPDLCTSNCFSLGSLACKFKPSSDCISLVSTFSFWLTLSTLR